MLLAWQWQWPPLQPAPGFDESWTAGLSMATHLGLVFGEQVVFTYGPLGFLSAGGLWQVHLAEASVAYTFVLRFAFALAVFASTRRTFGTVLAFVIALVVASVDSLLLEPVVFLIVAVWAVTANLSHRRAVAYALAGGAFAGLQLLDKVSVGISLAVMTAVFVLSLVGRRRDYVAAAFLGFVASVLVFWTALGQPAGALPNYILNAARITLGYGPAAGIEAPGLGWQYTAAIVGLALGLWAAWQMTAEMKPRQRWGVMLLWTAFWFFAFKEGFVRHDPEHDVSFFGALLGGFFAFRWRSWQRPIALLGVAALVVFALAAQTSSLTSALDPGRDVSTAFNRLRDVLSASRRAALIAAGRAEIEATEPIPRRRSTCFAATPSTCGPPRSRWRGPTDWTGTLSPYSSPTTLTPRRSTSSMPASLPHPARPSGSSSCRELLPMVGLGRSTRQSPAEQSCAATVRYRPRARRRCWRSVRIDAPRPSLSAPSVHDGARPCQCPLPRIRIRSSR